ncbi:DUF711 family protein [Candidatus Poribacteria bacterium]|nr:DUF711 family protein [Candidatus Poribacteria bacterium]
MKIRTITTGIPSAFSSEQLQRASEFNRHCRAIFEANGYEVQTTRLSSQAWNEILDLDGVLELEHRAQELGIEFFSLGSIFPDGRQTPFHLELVADVISRSQIFSASVTLTSERIPSHDSRMLEYAEKTAIAIHHIAHNTESGFGNMRFAALMNCRPNTPFFPAAYWHPMEEYKGMNFGIGWQAADLVHAAFANAPNLDAALRKMKGLMEQEGKQIIALAEMIERETGVHFVGLDVSPAPMGNESIANAIEAQLPGKFGEPGTLTAAAGLTRTLDSLDLPRCGYSGLMLPVLEDDGLGKRSREGCFNLDSLLLYSSVCGTGLDTIPIPGDTSINQICTILTDVASLSIRWGKPLSARLFPVPGLGAGDLTRFNSPYLTNTTVMAL